MVTTFVRGECNLALCAAFETASARGKLVMQPPFGRDGHHLFASPVGLPLGAEP